MRIEAVVFDIGNVLISWQPEQFFDRKIGKARRQALFAQLDLHGMNDAVDRGADFRQTVTDFALANRDWHDEIMMWHDNWLDMAQPAISDSVAILQQLKHLGVPVFALTNFGIQTFELARPVYPFLDLFDRRYVSGHMRVIKPEARIYQMVEDDCGCNPEALLFTDDRADNIAAADARGWQTHLFEDAAGLEARLRKEGVL